jgi:hypothetical protein
MPLIEYPAATATVHLASWLWMNREAFGTAWSRVSDHVASSLAAPRAEIHRLGSVIISVRDDQTQVLGVLHEHSARLDGIETAVGGLASGQAALGHSLAVLQNLSMLTLGLSAVSSLILFRQLHALRVQLTRLERTTHRIGALVEAQQLGQLETGLNQLKDGMEDMHAGRADQGRTCISQNAANNLALNVNLHANLLSRELKSGRAERSVLRLLFRHMTIGLMGVAGCHLALGHTSRANEAISSRMGLIETYAKEMFRQTVGDNPVRFLCPGMATRGVTVEFLVELYRQAALAKAVESPDGVGAAELIESWRTRLYASRDPFWSSTLNGWQSELAEALAAVEEVNRIKGFALGLGGIASANQSHDEVLAAIQREQGEPGCRKEAQFAYFPS